MFSNFLNIALLDLKTPGGLKKSSLCIPQPLSLPLTHKTCAALKIIFEIQAADEEWVMPIAFQMHVYMYLPHLSLVDTGSWLKITHFKILGEFEGNLSPWVRWFILIMGGAKYLLLIVSYYASILSSQHLSPF